MPRKDNIDVARGPMRCAFGAVRVGALLGRVRLHLQTDRFLAAHRGDTLWEEACREAGLALAELVSRMAEGEMDMPLTAIQERAHPSESALRDSGQKGWGTRKTGIATLARCSAAIERGRP